ncbi:MAG: N-acetylmuramoyl-L-alanine amidase [Rhodospirillaceae bacterium]|nr:N-acetylmuramoyl-L-alanine amidase [Rhodospirillaceae bacterium]
MIERPSPNHEPRPPGKTIDMLVLHYTGMVDAGEALRRLCEPASKVSAHYLIDEDGAVYRLVAEDRRAWHAGVARWAGETDINGISIGIELANSGHDHGYRDFPEAQMAALIDLAGGIVARHGIPAARVLGHSDVAPHRKLDPGEKFDWKRLAAAGIGLWPEAITKKWLVETASPAEGPDFDPGDSDPKIAEAQSALARFGYDVETTGVLDARTTTVLAAFQRHFRPRRIDGRLDAETAAILAALVALLPPGA